MSQNRFCRITSSLPPLNLALSTHACKISHKHMWYYQSKLHSRVKDTSMPIPIYETSWYVFYLMPFLLLIWWSHMKSFVYMWGCLKNIYPHCEKNCWVLLLILFPSEPLKDCYVYWNKKIITCFQSFFLFFKISIFCKENSPFLFSFEQLCFQACNTKKLLKDKVYILHNVDLIFYEKTRKGSSRSFVAK